MLDGMGEQVALLDVPDLDFARFDARVHGQSRLSVADYGWMYYTYVGDVDGDGVDEAIVASRQGCRIFGLA